MTRPSREQVLMETAFLWATRSTCSRLSVGAVIHRDGRILVQGYNGAPAGLPHCDHECRCGFLGGDSWLEDHATLCPAGPSGCRAVHAEQNAIAWAARVGVRLEGSEMICTHQPCLACARSLINAGVERVLFVEPYRLMEGLDLLHEAGIEVIRFVDYTHSRLIG